MKRLGAWIRPVMFALVLPIPPLVPPAPAPAPDSAWRDGPARAAETAYARLLARHVRPGVIEGKRVHVVDYVAIRRDPDLAVALEELAAARTDAMGKAERLAFWLNAYNLLAIRLVADGYPVDSVLDLGRRDDDVFGRTAGIAGGRAVSLSEIENDILRREFREPRIHFALVAAALSCPDLRLEPYDGARLDAQLAEATAAFLADTNRGIRRTSDGVAISQLLHSFHQDFEVVGGVVAFVRDHAPSDTAAWLHGVEDRHDLEKIPYDWTLNDEARAARVAR